MYKWCVKEYVHSIKQSNQKIGNVRSVGQKRCQICQIFINCRGICVLVVEIDKEENQEIANLNKC
jgi:radical SAM protein with 4Fe4S-binding SPASM domain